MRPLNPLVGYRHLLVPYIFRRSENDARVKSRDTPAQLQEKRRRLTVDPLDPTGGMVSECDALTY